MVDIVVERLNAEKNRLLDLHSEKTHGFQHYKKIIEDTESFKKFTQEEQVEHFKEMAKCAGELISIEKSAELIYFFFKIITHETTKVDIKTKVNYAYTEITNMLNKSIQVLENDCKNLEEKMGNDGQLELMSRFYALKATYKEYRHLSRFLYDMFREYTEMNVESSAALSN